MNRLRLMLVGAALITGGSALASAQVMQQDVAYRDRDHDRDRDRDRDRDHDRGRYNNYPSIATMMATAMTAESIGTMIAMTVDITGAMTTTGAMTATTGAGTDVAGSTGTVTAGFTNNEVSSF